MTVTEDVALERARQRAARDLLTAQEFRSRWLLPESVDVVPARSPHVSNASPIEQARNGPVTVVGEFIVNGRMVREISGRDAVIAPAAGPWRPRLRSAEAFARWLDIPDLRLAAAQSAARSAAWRSTKPMCITLTACLVVVAVAMVATSGSRIDGYCSVALAGLLSALAYVLSTVETKRRTPIRWLSPTWAPVPPTTDEVDDDGL